MQQYWFQLIFDFHTFIIPSILSVNILHYSETMVFRMTNATEHDLYTYDIMTKSSCILDISLLYTEQNTQGLEVNFDS
jgi:hypothetical protein